MTATGRRDLVAVLLDEHRALNDRTRPLTGIRSNGDPARSVAELLAEICRYGNTVLGHLDPLIRRYVPDGEAHADRRLGDYVQVERLVTELRRHRPGDARSAPLLGRLTARLREHLADQERELLPQLRRHVPDEVLRQRGVLASRGGRGLGR